MGDPLWSRTSRGDLIKPSFSNQHRASGIQTSRVEHAHHREHDIWAAGLQPHHSLDILCHSSGKKSSFLLKSARTGTCCASLQREKVQLFVDKHSTRVDLTRFARHRCIPGKRPIQRGASASSSVQHFLKGPAADHRMAAT